MFTNNIYVINQYIISKLHEPYRIIISYYKKNVLSILNKVIRLIYKVNFIEKYLI